MTRDILGNRIKKVLTGYEQTFMEKFYINRGKIYQIVRVDRILKMGGNLVEITYIKPGVKRIRRVTLTQENFENRKHFHTYAKAKRQLVAKEDTEKLFVVFDCPTCREKHYRERENSDNVIIAIENQFLFKDCCDENPEASIQVELRILTEEELREVDKN